MTLYLDTSALLKRYLEEADSARYTEILARDARWLTARVTWVEAHRNLGQRLKGADRHHARAALTADWRHIAVVEIDEALAEDAVAIADVTAVRTLDALHLAAARRVGSESVTFVTADLRQAIAARALGFTTLGS